MDTVRVTLTVFFEDPFWVGVFERVSDGKLSVCRVTFGAEPSDRELWDFVLGQYGRLRFGPAIQAGERQRADSPKRRQREAGRQLRPSGAGTKAQQALAMQREELKTARKQAGRERKQAEKQRKFDLKQQKRKEKHRGR